MRVRVGVRVGVGVRVFVGVRVGAGVRVLVGVRVGATVRVGVGVKVVSATRSRGVIASTLAGELKRTAVISTHPHSIKTLLNTRFIISALSLY